VAPGRSWRGGRGQAARAGRSGRPLLTAAQDKQWRAVYARELARQRRAGNPGAGGSAAALAWAAVKRAGGQTILAKYGSTQVEILRDTARLLNSLSPGGRDNVLEAGPGRIKVGTRVEYAEAHHRGLGKLPARPLWPDSLADWPEEWKDRLRGVLRDGVAALVRRALEGN
jgi:hypothetical protein